MWNSRKYAVMAIAGVGLATAAATPAAACVDWGYTGIYNYDWPYANAGVSNPAVYSYRSCGGNYLIQGWGECNGYGPCGWAPFPPVTATVPVAETAGRGLRPVIITGPGRRAAVRRRTSTER